MSTRTRTSARTPSRRRRAASARAAAAAGAVVLGLGLAGCGDTAGDEDGTSVEDVQEADEQAQVGTDEEGAQYAYDGPYDSGYADQQDSLVGEEVTVSAEVDEVLDDTSFTIAGGDSGVAPLLVVDAVTGTAVEEGQGVDVSGTVQLSFDVASVEERLGVDLDDDAYSAVVGQTYLEASAVDVGLEDGGS